jgi:hypothetical protein
MQAIRLEIKLGGPEKDEVDVASLAKVVVEWPAAPPVAVKWYESEGDGAPESGVGTDGGGTGGEKKAKKVQNLFQFYFIFHFHSHLWSHVVVVVVVVFFRRRKKNLGSEYGPIHRTGDRRADVHRAGETAKVFTPFRVKSLCSRKNCNGNRKPKQVSVARARAHRGTEQLPACGHQSR